MPAVIQDFTTGTAGTEIGAFSANFQEIATPATNLRPVIVGTSPNAAMQWQGFRRWFYYDDRSQEDLSFFRPAPGNVTLRSFRAGLRGTATARGYECGPTTDLVGGVHESFVLSNETLGAPFLATFSGLSVAPTDTVALRGTEQNGGAQLLIELLINGVVAGSFTDTSPLPAGFDYLGYTGGQDAQVEIAEFRSSLPSVLGNVTYGTVEAEDRQFSPYVSFSNLNQTNGDIVWAVNDSSVPVSPSELVSGVGSFPNNVRPVTASGLQELFNTGFLVIGNGPYWLNYAYRSAASNGSILDSPIRVLPLGNGPQATAGDDEVAKTTIESVVSDSATEGALVSFTLAAGGARDDAHVSDYIRVQSATNSLDGALILVTDYVASTRTITGQKVKDFGFALAVGQEAILRDTVGQVEAVISVNGLSADAIAAAAVTKIQEGLASAAAQTAAAAEVAAIKAKTDPITYTVSGQVDANIAGAGGAAFVNNTKPLDTP